MRIRRLLAALSITAAAMPSVLTVQGTADTQGDTTWGAPAPGDTTWVAPAGWDWGAPAGWDWGSTTAAPTDTTWVAPAKPGDTTWFTPAQAATPQDVISCC